MPSLQFLRTGDVQWVSRNRGGRGGEGGRNQLPWVSGGFPVGSREHIWPRKDRKQRWPTVEK